MSTTIVNGAPMTYLRGVQDKSTRTLIVEPEAIPTHLPKVYIFAQKGPSTPQLVVGNGRDQMYGSESFDLRKKFATHQTVLSNLLNAEGNSQMIERLIPTDAGPKANYRLSLDLLPTQIVQYKRDTNGGFLLDANGEKQPTTPASTTQGYKAKWVMSSVTTKTASDTDSDLFGVAGQTAGDQVEGGVQSTRFPILEFWASSEGDTFNNSGHRIWSPSVNSNGGVNSRFAQEGKAYPFRMTAIRRSSAIASAKAVETESGEPFFDFCLKPGAINSVSDSQMYLGDIYASKYENLKDKRFPVKYADMSGMKIYQDNIDTVLDMLYTVESTFFGEVGSDFTVDADDEKYLFNLFTGTSTTGAAYYSFELNSSDANAVRLSEGTNLFAKGGSDGTMTNAVFNQLVADAVSEYGNENSLLQDTAMYPESIIYDTGFKSSTKDALCKFISIRKDTAVVLATYEFGEKPMSAAEDHSMAVALRTKLQMYPESEYFGTPVMRGVVVGRSGTLRNSQFSGKLPLTIELAVKAAKMMGAGNGDWKVGYVFDRAPTNLINMFDDVSAPFTPANQRIRDWDVGLNYAMNFSRSALFFPCIKTAYNDDTSVLNSFFTMMACVELEKIGERVHREFSGSTTLTNAQLIDRVNKSIAARTTGKFADMVKIVPAAYISGGDEARGYSYTILIKIYANNMKTVATLEIQAYRMSDLAA